METVRVRTDKWRRECEGRHRQGRQSPEATDSIAGGVAGVDWNKGNTDADFG